MTTQERSGHDPSRPRPAKTVFRKNSNEDQHSQLNDELKRTSDILVKIHEVGHSVEGYGMFGCAADESQMSGISGGEPLAMMCTLLDAAPRVRRAIQRARDRRSAKTFDHYYPRMMTMIAQEYTADECTEMMSLVLVGTGEERFLDKEVRGFVSNQEGVAVNGIMTRGSKVPWMSLATKVHADICQALEDRPSGSRQERRRQMRDQDDVGETSQDEPAPVLTQAHDLMRELVAVGEDGSGQYRCLACAAPSPFGPTALVASGTVTDRIVSLLQMSYAIRTEWDKCRGLESFVHDVFDGYYGGMAIRISEGSTALAVMRTLCTGGMRGMSMHDVLARHEH